VPHANVKVTLLIQSQYPFRCIHPYPVSAPFPAAPIEQPL
jgi:hypothetical protein